MRRYTQTIALFIFSLGFLALAGCSLITPYTPPVQQGKILPKDVMQKIKPGMNKAQIQYLLGSPDMLDPLNNNQWVYVYTYQQTIHSAREEKQLILTFKDDKLQNVGGNYPPPQTIYTSAKKSAPQTQ